MTWRMPSMVTKSRRRLSRRRPCVGYIRQSAVLICRRQFAVQRDQLHRLGEAPPAERADVPRISPMPGMKIRMSPGESFRKINSTASAACSVTGSRLRYWPKRISTGTCARRR